MINRPFGDGLYMFIPPISGDDAVVYWLCQAILNPGLILQLDPLRTPHAAGARKDPRASASRVSRQATLGQSGSESTGRHHEGSSHSSNQELVRQQTWQRHLLWIGNCSKKPSPTWILNGSRIHFSHLYPVPRNPWQ